MEKMFKGNTPCPMTGAAIDSPQCRQCKWYFRAGTETFIWCNRDIEELRPKQPSEAIDPPKRKRGRPKKVQTGLEFPKRKPGRPKKVQSPVLKKEKAQKRPKSVRKLKK